MRQPLHCLKHHSAAHTIVPSFAKIILGSIHHGKMGVRHNRIAWLQAHGGDFGCALSAYVKKNPFAGIDPVTLFLRHNVNIANAGDGTDRSLGTDDGPALIDQRLIKPATQHLHGEIAFIGDATNHPAQFVHVRVHHDARAAGALHSNYRAQAVIADLVR